MDIFVARQAIFDSDLDVYGYELLFRSCLTNAFDGTDGALASLQVITNSFFSIGAEKMLGGKPAFINFPRSLLVDDCASVLPKDSAVIEILETVEADEEVLEACRNLKKRGYRLAMDDFVDSEKTRALAHLADIIKVDLQVTSPQEQRDMIRRYSRYGVKLLAEKVETREQFEAAKKLGFSYFQGYFFARPVVMQAREIPGSKLNYLRILQEIQRPELEFRRLEEILRLEVSLTFKLLRFVNSAAFGISRRIESIREALVLIGENEIRKFASVVVLPHLAGNKPSELVLTAVTRARFGELLARLAGLDGRASELFLMGLFSLLDAMMDRPLDELLEPLHISDAMRSALIDKEDDHRNVLATIHHLICANETAEWETLIRNSGLLRIKPGDVAECYLHAVEWAGAASSAVTQTDG